MSFKVEIIGAPASGKTYFYNYLAQIFKKKKNLEIQTKSFKDDFIDYYLRKKTNVNVLKKIFYSYYIKNVQIKSKFLFKKEYKDLNLFIKKKIKSDKKYKKVIKLYKKYIDTTKYTAERKFRMIKNFEIDYLGAKSKKSNSKFEIVDEGFFQKIFVNFKGNNNFYFNNQNQNTYLKLVPNPDLIILFNTNIKICLNRAKKRKDGFLYKAKKLKFVSTKNYFNNNIIKYSKHKKIPIFELNGTKSCKKNFQIFFNLIQNYNRKLK